MQPYGGEKGAYMKKYGATILGHQEEGQNSAKVDLWVYFSDGWDPVPIQATVSEGPGLCNLLIF